MNKSENLQTNDGKHTSDINYQHESALVFF